MIGFGVADPFFQPLRRDGAWIIDVMFLHDLKKIVDDRVVIVVIDVVGARVAIGVVTTRAASSWVSHDLGSSASVSW